MSKLYSLYIHLASALVPSLRVDARVLAGPVAVVGHTLVHVDAVLAVALVAGRASA